MRRMRISLGLLLCTSPCLAVSQRPPEQTFARHPVPLAFANPRASAVILDDPQKRLYRTRLRAALKEPPNFAAIFRVDSWGCGSGCFQFAAVNLRTGAASIFPFSISAPLGGNSIDFRRTSSAVHVVGLLNEASPGDRWYLWNGKDFTLLSEVKLPLECFESSDEAILRTVPCGSLTPSHAQKRSR